MELLFCLNTSCIIPYRRIFLILYQNVLVQFYFSDGIAFPGLEEKSRQPLYFFLGVGWVALPKNKDIIVAAQPGLCNWKFSWDQNG